MDSLFLYGPPGSGKSTLGKLLARRPARPFVDLDAEIEKAAGRSIPAIFAAEGEAGFRARELRALEEVSTRPRAVVALGGGALVNAAARPVAVMMAVGVASPRAQGQEMTRTVIACESASLKV